MSGFTSDWLLLREPADTAARSVEFARRAGEVLSNLPTVSALDLGTGTGANIRFLARYLGSRQHWCAVDDDEALLVQVRPRCLVALPSQSRVDVVHTNLTTLADTRLFAGRGLVTASALLDLVSLPWLEATSGRCTAPVVLFALTYDGRIDWLPEEEGDAEVRMLVNRHQLRDKTFGLALGPHATEAAVEVFGRAGYGMTTEASDWRLTPGEQALQRALIEGWCTAAREERPSRSTAIGDWGRRRLVHVAAGRSYITVGHRDALGVRRQT